MKRKIGADIKKRIISAKHTSETIPHNTNEECSAEKLAKEKNGSEAEDFGIINWIRRLVDS